MTHRSRVDASHPGILFQSRLKAPVSMWRLMPQTRHNNRDASECLTSEFFDPNSATLAHRALCVPFRPRPLCCGLISFADSSSQPPSRSSCPLCRCTSVRLLQPNGPLSASLSHLRCCSRFSGKSFLLAGRWRWGGYISAATHFLSSGWLMSTAAGVRKLQRFYFIKGQGDTNVRVGSTTPALLQLGSGCFPHDHEA